MSEKRRPDEVLELLLKCAVDVSERMTILESRLCVADVAIHILVNAHPDKEALKAHFTRAFASMQQSDTAQENPRQTFAYEQLLERIFESVD